MNYNNIHVLILSAGKIEKELESIFGTIPSGLIPLHGKPVIFRIIDKLLKEGFKKISITTGFKKEILEKIISEQYEDQIKINFVTTDFEKPPGNSILTAIERIQECQLLVILGDTLVENELSNLIQKNNDFVLMSNEFETPANWCVVTSKDGKLDLIFDKKKDLEKTDKQYALVGVYYFDDLTSLKHAYVQFNHQERIEISDLIRKYKEEKVISAIICEQWYDAGHVENYFVSKQMLLKARYFNSLRFDRSLEIVTKTSENTSKLINEIEWYKQIPNDLSKLIPKIIDFDQSKKPFLKLEYVKHPTLAELWLYSDFSSKLWIGILKKLFEILNQFKKYTKSVEQQRIQGFAPDVLKKFEKNRWNGNIRELEKVVEYATITCRSEYISDADLPSWQFDQTNLNPKNMQNTLETLIDSKTIKEASQKFERLFLERKFKENNWNVQLTADEIGLTRQSLHRKMKALGLKREQAKTFE